MTTSDDTPQAPVSAPSVIVLPKKPQQPSIVDVLNSANTFADVRRGLAARKTFETEPAATVVASVETPPADFIDDDVFDELMRTELSAEQHPDSSWFAPPWHSFDSYSPAGVWQGPLRREDTHIEFDIRGANAADINSFVNDLNKEHSVVYKDRRIAARVREQGPVMRVSVGFEKSTLPNEYRSLGEGERMLSYKEELWRKLYISILDSNSPDPFSSSIHVRASSSAHHIISKEYSFRDSQQIALHLSDIDSKKFTPVARVFSNPYTIGLFERESLEDVVKSPFKSLTDEDERIISLRHFFKGRAPGWKSFGAILGSFGLFMPIHEGIHAIVNSATGGVNKEIVFNKFYGGDIYHALFPNVIQSKWMIPIIGGYVLPEPANNAAMTATLLAPYALTPIGVGLLYYGQERNSRAAAIAGAGIVGAHFGGIIGDFLTTGRVAFESTSTALGAGPLFSKDTSAFVMVPAFIGAYYLGKKALALSYRLARAAGRPIADGLNALADRYEARKL